MEDCLNLRHLHHLHHLNSSGRGLTRIYSLGLVILYGVNSFAGALANSNPPSILAILPGD